jgi:glycosyltransferase involved in cell wall biosynthesis
LSVAVRVHVVDPSAYTPPYDHALCRALGGAGAEVELFTSRFAYGRVASPEGYARHELFYRAAVGAPGSRLRTAAKLAEHVPDMLRYRRRASAADVVHFQWLAVQHLDRHLLPTRRSPVGARRSPAGQGRPLVLTAHDILPREPRPGQLRAQRRLYECFDAVIVHSAHGRRRLTEDLGTDPARVHVIPHGVLRPWEGQRAQPLPPDLRAVEGPVVLFFGLLRPYKGLDLLLDAWQEIAAGASAGAELWIVGMPRMDLTAVDAAHDRVLSRSRLGQATPGASLSGSTRGRQTASAGPIRQPAAVGAIRFLPRFVSDQEILALMRRASLVVLPYREIDHSGVAFTALGAGAPLLLSDVGGFPEIAATGAARVFPAGDARALGRTITELLADSAALAEMATCAGRAGDGEYSWQRIAERTLALYGRLLQG